MATPENRADLRNLVRTRLSAWPDDVGTLHGTTPATYTAAVTSLTLAAALDISEKALVQIGDEVIRVKTVAGAVLSPVIRGDRGSTAAAHVAGEVVKVYPYWGWSDFEINRELDLAIDWLWPDAWILKPLTNTLLANNTDFGLPAGTVYPTGQIVKRVELLDTTVTPNIYREKLGWKHIGDRLILTTGPLLENKTARIWLQGRYDRLASDATQLLASDPVECLVLRACACLLEQLLANRVRYVEYSAALNDRASTPDELQRQAYYFKNQAVVERDRISRPGLSGLASTRRTG